MKGNFRTVRIRKKQLGQSNRSYQKKLNSEIDKMERNGYDHTNTELERTGGMTLMFSRR